MQPTSQDRAIERAANGRQAGLTRRALLRHGAWLAGGAGLAWLLEACAFAPNATSAPAAVPSSAATKLVMLDAANIDAPDMAPRKQVVTDFMARNPDVTMDWRALPSNIQWDRVARTTLLSGEQVDMVNINGQFIRAWLRDGLLDDLSAHGQLQNAFASVDPSFLAAQSDDARDTFALPLTHASPAHVTAFFYNKTLLDKAGLQPPKTLEDMRAMVQPSFIVGVGNGLILGYLMFRSGLVPRPMALLGLIGGPLLCLAGIAALFGVLEPGSAQQSLAAMPEFLWELSLGIYLTVKGFRPSTAASQPARTATNELLAAV